MALKCQLKNYANYEMFYVEAIFLKRVLIAKIAFVQNILLFIVLLVNQKYYKKEHLLIKDHLLQKQATVKNQ